LFGAGSTAVRPDEAKERPTMLNRGKTRTLVLVSLALAGSLAAGAARAGSHVQWSIGINAPLAPGVAIGTVFSNGPAYYPQPVYVEPAPVVYAPAPLYVAPPPIYLRPRPVVYLPHRAYVQPRAVYLARPGHGRPVPVIGHGWDRDGHGARGGWHRSHDRGHGGYGGR
jgi:hypothetical protein